MNCSGFEIELEQLVEARGATLTDQAMTHAMECSACSQRWRDHRLIDAALAVWLPVQVSPSLAETVLAQVQAERTPVSMPSRSAVRTRGRWLVVVAAACLLAILGFGMATHPGSGDRSLARREGRPSTNTGGLTPPRSEENGPSTKQSSLEVASSVAAVLDDLRMEYRELAAETSATAREFAVVLPSTPVAPWGIENNGDRGSENVANNLPPGAVSVIGRSIGTQISQAMDFLWVAVPDSVPRG